jgi:hypothetical protein
MLKGECTRFLTWTDPYASLESWRALASSSSKASPYLSFRYFMAMRSSVRQPSRLATMEAVPARNALAAALLQGLQEVVEQLLVGHQGAGASVFRPVCQAGTAAGMVVNFPREVYAVPASMGAPCFRSATRIATLVGRFGLSGFTSRLCSWGRSTRSAAAVAEAHLHRTHIGHRAAAAVGQHHLAPLQLRQLQLDRQVLRDAEMHRAYVRQCRHRQGHQLRPGGVGEGDAAANQTPPPVPSFTLATGFHWVAAVASATARPRSARHGLLGVFRALLHRLNGLEPAARQRLSRGEASTSNRELSSSWRIDRNISVLPIQVSPEALGARRSRAAPP